MKAFIELPVWKSVDNKTAVKYQCLKNLKTEKFCIQNADIFYLPITDSQLNEAKKIFIDLFIDVNPEERCSWFDSIEEAITAHESDFS